MRSFLANLPRSLSRPGTASGPDSSQSQAPSASDTSQSDAVSRATVAEGGTLLNALATDHDFLMGLSELAMAVSSPV